MNHFYVILCILLWLAAAVALVVCYRNVRFVDASSPDDPPTSSGVSTKTIVVFYNFVALAVITLVAWALLPPRLPAAIRLAVAPTLVLIAAAAGYGMLRSRYRSAWRLRSGDPQSALRLIRDEIESQGRTAERLNDLGLAYMATEQWPQAVESFEEAERLGFVQVEGNIFRGNRALALARAGRTDEALALFAELVASDSPETVFVVVNYCRILIELGRRDEARRQLQGAEERFGEVRGLSAKERGDVHRALKACRDMLSGERSEEAR